jgi:hypothetical protein
MPREKAAISGEMDVARQPSGQRVTGRGQDLAAADSCNLV